MLYVDNSKTNGSSKVTIIFSEKIFDQQFVDSSADLSEPIRIPSSVMTLAVIRSLVLKIVPLLIIREIRRYKLSFFETRNKILPDGTTIITKFEKGCD